jgi:nitrogen fixation/metabolism regulation signal transduction histidine kinase
VGWTPRTLKAQLTLLFLVLTLGPAILLTALAAREALFAVARWENEGVERALSGSMEMARELLARAENDLRQRGQLLAADPVMGVSPHPEAVRRSLATSYNLDFVQVYDLEGKLLFETTRDPLLDPPGTLAGVAAIAASARPFLENGQRDLLAFAGYAGSPGESEWILVAGMYLDSGFYLRRDDLAQGVAYYRQLPTLIRFKQRVLLFTLGGVVLALAVLAAWTARKLAARVSGPVEALGAGMEQVARGSTTVQVEPRGTEEMVELILCFNAMSGELSRSRRDLARAERLAAWREAARRVAHEIKNALTPITFSAHRLRKTGPALPEGDRARFEESLGTVLEEIEGLHRLASSFGELARLPVPELAPVDLREVVDASAAAFSEERRRIETAVPDTPVVVEADRTLLRQALTNLVKNAVEATGLGERIWIRLTADPTGARLTVEDEGPGWAAGVRDQALDPYVTTKPEGTGLGLSVVQRTVLQHGGFLELDDRPGGGARVTLVLPGPEAARNPGSRDPGREVS